MRFGDLQALRPEHIQGDEISFITGKNRKTVRIPVLPEARRILEKYNYDLPKISTQKQNDYLEEVMQAAKIDTLVIVVDFKGTQRIEQTVPKWELISTHSAKRTFVTILRKYNVSVEAIMRITGNCRSTIESYIVSTNDDALNEVRAVFA
jgi:integrase